MTDSRNKTNRPKADLSEIGKIPPQAIDLEEAVLGSCLLESRTGYLVSKILKSRHFYKEAHQVIYEAIETLMDRSQPVDILTVANELRSTGKLELVGGAYYISTLTNRIASSANVETHCRIIIEKFLLREVIRISADSIRDAYEGSEDTFKILETASMGLHSLTNGLSDGRDFTTSEYLDQLQETVEANEKGITPGIPTGCAEYDQYSGGQQKGGLIIYAGRPGMGKSARMINEVYFQLQKGYKVVIHSIEMTGVEVCSRLIGLHLNLPYSHITRKKTDLQKFKEAKEWLSKMPLKIYIYNKIRDIERETSIMVTSNKCDIVYVDYLQLATAGFRDKTPDVEAVSIALKLMAKKLDIPVVALAQLNRSVETRGGDKIPIMADLKNSGQIEQDADVVEFLYRPEYYEITHDEEGNSLVGKIYYINGKMRGGKPNQTIIQNWDGPTNRISPIPKEYIETGSSFDPLAPNDGFDNDSPF